MSTWETYYAECGAEIEAAKRAAIAEFLAAPVNSAYGAGPAVPPQVSRNTWTSVLHQPLSRADATLALKYVWAAVAKAWMHHVGPYSSDGSIIIDVHTHTDGVRQLDLRANVGTPVIPQPYEVDFVLAGTPNAEEGRPIYTTWAPGPTGTWTHRYPGYSLNDGVSLAVGKKCLVAWSDDSGTSGANPLTSQGKIDQGIYVVTNAGSGGASAVVTRVGGVLQPGLEVLVQLGTNYGKTLWKLRNEGAISPDVTEQDWRRITGGGSTGGGSVDHPSTTNRDLPNQHPWYAVTDDIGDATVTGDLITMPVGKRKARVSGAVFISRVDTSGFNDGDHIMLFITDASPTNKVAFTPNSSGSVGYPIGTPPKSGGDGHGEFVNVYAPTTVWLWKDDTGHCWRFATPIVGSSEVGS